MTETDDFRVYGKPGHLIRRLQQIAVAIFVEQTREFDITPVQYSAVLAAELHPGIDQTALCNLIGFDRSTIGEVVARLESKRLIKRRAAAGDKRKRLLYITPQGRRLIRAIAPAIEAVQERILAPLRPSERGLFMDMLTRLVHINNEQSRAPQRPKNVRPRRAGPGMLEARHVRPLASGRNLRHEEKLR